MRPIGDWRYLPNGWSSVIGYQLPRNGHHGARSCPRLTNRFDAFCILYLRSFRFSPLASALRDSDPIEEVSSTRSSCHVEGLACRSKRFCTVFVTGHPLRLALRTRHVDRSPAGRGTSLVILNGARVVGELFEETLGLALLPRFAHRFTV
jgi:hypothetical protein